MFPPPGGWNQLSNYILYFWPANSTAWLPIRLPDCIPYFWPANSTTQLHTIFLTCQFDCPTAYYISDLPTTFKFTLQYLNVRDYFLSFFLHLYVPFYICILLMSSKTGSVYHCLSIPPSDFYIDLVNRCLCHYPIAWAYTTYRLYIAYLNNCHPILVKHV